MNAVEDYVIELRDVAKSYSLEGNPWRRLWSQLRGRLHDGPQYHALHRVNLKIRRGEVVGVIGRNGAGKSTLLQLVCGVLDPSSGVRKVQGRVAALLELGAGFNPELTGRENVRLNGPLLGIGTAEMERRMHEIVEFAGIGEFIDQPVRSYSSGMFMRLAFSMATSVEPDILVIDEALSVGDGAFSRKSFDRIMALRDRGVTVLFCSHSLFQVEAVCERAIWLHDGTVKFDGRSSEAVVEYQAWLDRQDQGTQEAQTSPRWHHSAQAKLTRVALREGSEASLRSGHDDLVIDVSYASDPALPGPQIGVTVHASDGRTLTSAGSWVDGFEPQRDGAGEGRATLRFPQLNLLKGGYTVSVYLLCERGIHIYASAEHVARFDVVQDHIEQGIVSLPREWSASVA